MGWDGEGVRPGHTDNPFFFLHLSLKGGPVGS